MNKVEGWGTCSFDTGPFSVADPERFDADPDPAKLCGSFGSGSATLLNTKTKFFFLLALSAGPALKHCLDPIPVVKTLFKTKNLSK